MRSRTRKLALSRAEQRVDEAKSARDAVDAECVAVKHREELLRSGPAR